MYALLNCSSSSEIKIWVPEPDHSELPALWWDIISDKCLLLGVYKHGKRIPLISAEAYPSWLKARGGLHPGRPIAGHIQYRQLSRPNVEKCNPQ